MVLYCIHLTHVAFERTYFCPTTYFLSVPNSTRFDDETYTITPVLLYIIVSLKLLNYLKPRSFAKNGGVETELFVLLPLLAFESYTHTPDREETPGCNSIILF